MRKTHRQRLIARIIAASQVRSQEQLRALLASGGVHATQGTISRDLREMGVVKAPTGYTLNASAEGARRSSSDLESALRRWMLSVETAGATVVIKTEPGHASALASQVDLAPPPGMVGSLAGDDTIFIATRSPRDARAACIFLQRLGGIL